ncbi:hypothetical protein AB0I39_37170 [Kitasatospora purpeofusca]|uniref:hypothetical protein n=1 Tax=Kitasatospora purpeofusca TaxID=67352 RepID=UPI0033C5E27D
MRTTTRCEDCGGALVRDTGQFIDSGQLWWGSEGSCRSCPAAWCDEDSGPVTPEHIRQALLAAHGPVRLRLAGPPGSGLVPVLRALREVHGLSLVQARAMADELRTVGLTGTLVEMEFLAAGLRRRSVMATVDPEAVEPAAD